MHAGLIEVGGRFAAVVRPSQPAVAALSPGVRRAFRVSVERSRIEHMSERRVDGGSAEGARSLPSAESVAGMVARLAVLDRDVSDAERIDQIRALEELKSAAAAAQARATADLAASQVAQQAALRVRPSDQGKGVAAQVALARRESPVRGNQHLGLARALVHEMPHTLRALAGGRLSEWRATLLVRETACLTREDRATVDRLLVADPSVVEGWGDRRLAAEARRMAYRRDPEAAVRRSRKAESERRVTCRPAPDTMAYLTALLPLAEAVSVYAALSREADCRRSDGDARSRGQVMADALVERVTGRAAGKPASAEVEVVMTDQALLRGDREPAEVVGFGPVPSSWARDLLAAALDGEGTVWLRRLFTAPATGELVALDSKRRLFPLGLRRLLRLRDRECRTPWCDAPVRHSDHVVPHEAGGPTSAGNGQGLCEGCNQTKQAPGWRARPRPGPRRHTVEVSTPTGHTYRSTAPPLPPAQRQSPATRLERHFAELLRSA